MAGREHQHNTFVIVYYVGPAEMRGQTLVISLIEEPRSSKIVRYDLEERVRAIN